MSKLINADWTCPACDSANVSVINKPNTITPTIAQRKCESCDSEFLLSFKKVSGEMNTEWKALKGDITKKGKKAFNSRTKPRARKSAAQPTKEL